jgi:hypothetical protein
MRTNLLFLPVFLLTFAPMAVSQLSPGDLAKEHAQLEGMFNCTKCHELGEKVSNTKCLDCHKVLKSRVTRRKGYHASKEVKGKDCASCHNDHHGRNFDLIRFDEDKFNHRLTGFELTGKHKTTDCRECHQPDFIDDKALKKRKNTFLGLAQECNSCHEDYHQKTLAKDCASCHNTDEFAPAKLFNHDKTDFALAGKHKTVECIECHKKETRNGQDFQRFAGISFESCSNCHNDVHKKNLGNKCQQCHTEQSFSDFQGKRRFNHEKTHFPLKGKHKEVNCAECHSMEVRPDALFQDKLGIATKDCVACHEDVHKGKLGTNCTECHSEKTFRIGGSLKKFDHGLTDFKLEGKHEVVDCRKCHTESYTNALVFNKCAACHDDYHEGQFVAKDDVPDCKKCHTEDGFEGSSFSIADHNKTAFPLEEAHSATPCFVCHKQEERWNFRGIGERCTDCHEDIHKGEIDAKYYPNQTCENCHQSTSWQDNRFDHGLTPFQLSGSHAQQKCQACHVPDVDHKYGKFVDLSAACTACHEDKHDGQFEKNGVTDCAGCHGWESWEASNFNHDNTAFPLDGKHTEVACAGCHKQRIAGGRVFVQYKFDNFKCVVCHQ